MNKVLDFIRNNIVFFASSIAVVISLFIVLNRGTYSVEEDVISNSLIFDCPSVANAGETIECSLGINISDINVYGISARYVLTDGIVVSDFISNNWEVYLNDENGLVLVNLDGVSGNILVGNVKFTIPTDAESNSKYKIELIDINVGDGEDTVINLDNVSEEIRIKSSINTLDSISITGAILNEEFDKDKVSYTGTSNDDKITINVVKTDENSSLSGDIGERDIHYGTNIFNVVVTSETGVSKTYSIKIYKEFNFSSDKYVYNKDNNYLYVGNHKDVAILLNNIDVPDGLSKIIENNKLIISYENEELLNINIIYIYSDIYDLSNDYIYLGNGEIDISMITFVNCNDYLSNGKLEFKYNDVIIAEFNILTIGLGELIVDNKIISLSEEISYEDFISNITLGNEKLEYMVLNGESIVNSGSITDGMKLKIYYNDEVIDSYSIKIFDVSFSNNIILDRDKGYIKYKIRRSTIEEFLKDVNVVENVNLFVTNKDNEEKNSTDLLCTGDKLFVYVGSEKVIEYEIAVRGDANGDGRVSLIDLSQVRKHIVGAVDKETGESLKKEGIYFYAIDINDDNRISLIDLSKVRKIIVGADIDA